MSPASFQSEGLGANWRQTSLTMSSFVSPVRNTHIFKTCVVPLELVSDQEVGTFATKNSNRSPLEWSWTRRRIEFMEIELRLQQLHSVPALATTVATTRAQDAPFRSSSSSERCSRCISPSKNCIMHFSMPVFHPSSHLREIRSYSLEPCASSHCSSERGLHAIAALAAQLADDVA